LRRPKESSSTVTVAQRARLVVALGILNLCLATLAVAVGTFGIPSSPIRPIATGPVAARPSPSPSIDSPAPSQGLPSSPPATVAPPATPNPTEPPPASGPPVGSPEPSAAPSSPVETAAPTPPLVAGVTPAPLAPAGEPPRATSQPAVTPAPPAPTPRPPVATLTPATAKPATAAPATAPPATPRAAAGANPGLAVGHDRDGDGVDDHQNDTGKGHDLDRRGAEPPGRANADNAAGRGGGNRHDGVVLVPPLLLSASAWLAAIRRRFGRR
jgi:hypothetical protein